MIPVLPAQTPAASPSKAPAACPVAGQGAAQSTTGAGFMTLLLALAAASAAAGTGGAVPAAATGPAATPPQPRAGGGDTEEPADPGLVALALAASGAVPLPLPPGQPVAPAGESASVEAAGPDVHAAGAVAGESGGGALQLHSPGLAVDGPQVVIPPAPAGPAEAVQPAASPAGEPGTGQPAGQADVAPKGTRAIEADPPPLGVSVKMDQGMSLNRIARGPGAPPLKAEENLPAAAPAPQEAGPRTGGAAPGAGPAPPVTAQEMGPGAAAAPAPQEAGPRTGGGPAAPAPGSGQDSAEEGLEGALASAVARGAPRSPAVSPAQRAGTHAGEGDAHPSPEQPPRPAERRQDVQGPVVVADPAQRRVEEPPEPPRMALTSAGIERVAAAVRAAASQGGMEVRLRLHPETLGEVQVHVRWEGGVLTAHLEAATPAGREALAAGLHQLRSALQEQGVAVDQLHVGLRLDLEGHSRGQGPGSHASPPPPVAPLPIEAPPAEPTRLPAPAGRVDVWI